MTTRQMILLKYINWHTWRFNEAPTLRHLADAFGVTYPAMYWRVQKLRRCYDIRLETGYREPKRL